MLPEFRLDDGTPFDKERIFPYAYRHSFAQRHADAGVAIDVLAELLDHESYESTRGYYRVKAVRLREAVDRVTHLQFDRHGKRIWGAVTSLLNAERTRRAIGSVVVPFGTCSEPTNVAAAGGACPLRFRCVGCDHFSTDVSYLPELRAYLDDLLRNRERLRSMSTADDWARAEAAPSEEEIRRVRHLIHRVTEELDQLTDTERAEIHQATAIVRKTRQGFLGMPRIHPAPSRCSTGATRMTSSNPAVDAMMEGRRADTGRRRRRVLAALAEASVDGDTSVASIARRAGVDRSFLYRHRDLLAQIHAQAAEPTSAPGGRGPAVSRASLQSDLLAAHARTRRLADQLRRTEANLSKTLGEQVWRETGLGAPDDVDQLQARITTLEQQLVDLNLRHDERGEELDAARAANRELMAQLNRGHDLPQV